MNLRWAVTGYVLILGVGVPWYWRWAGGMGVGEEMGEGGGLWVVRGIGVPVWVVVSICAAVVLAGWTVWVIRALWTNQWLEGGGGGAVGGEGDGGEGGRGGCVGGGIGGGRSGGGDETEKTNQRLEGRRGCSEGRGANGCREDSSGESGAEVSVVGGGEMFGDVRADEEGRGGEPRSGQGTDETENTNQRLEGRGGYSAGRGASGCGEGRAEECGEEDDRDDKIEKTNQRLKGKGGRSGGSDVSSCREGSCGEGGVDVGVIGCEQIFGDVYAGEAGGGGEERGGRGDDETKITNQRLENRGGCSEGRGGEAGFEEGGGSGVEDRPEGGCHGRDREGVEGDGGVAGDGVCIKKGGRWNDE